MRKATSRAPRTHNPRLQNPDYAITSAPHDGHLSARPAASSKPTPPPQRPGEDRHGANRLGADGLGAEHTSTPRDPRQPKRGNVIPRPTRDFRQRPRGLRVLAIDGTPRRFLNMEIPQDRRTGEPLGPEPSSVCAAPGRCGHGYSHLMVSGRTVCDECRNEDQAAVAAELQAAGIEMGWGAVPMTARARRITGGDMASFSMIRRRRK
ncbi:MAG: hypothetical protein NTW19_15385 [Planctomycetota bacterium]|nr:hypothetical protein [Planctomycetota bacterium]